MASVSRSALQDALSAVDFPIAKDDLVVHAEQSNAPEDVRKALRSLPPVDYRSADEVLRSVGPDVGSGATDAQRSDPGFSPETPGVTPKA